MSSAFQAAVRSMPKGSPPFSGMKMTGQLFAISGNPPDANSPGQTPTVIPTRSVRGMSSKSTNHSKPD